MTIEIGLDLLRKLAPTIEVKILLRDTKQRIEAAGHSDCVECRAATAELEAIEAELAQLEEQKKLRRTIKLLVEKWRN